MRTVTVPALKAFSYRGRTVAVGEFITLPAVMAAAAARRGEVSLTKEGPPVPEPAPEPPPRRRYRRRDLQAE